MKTESAERRALFRSVFVGVGDLARLVDGPSEPLVVARDGHADLRQKGDGTQIKVNSEQ